MNYVITAAGAAASAVALPSRSGAGDQAPVALAGRTADTDAESAPSAPVPLQELRSQCEYDYSDYPEIFGKVPGGFVLEGQSIEMLCHWHRKAIDAVDRLTDRPDYQPTDEEVDDYCQLKNKILGAILSGRAATAGQVAAQLRAVLAEIECLKTPSIEDVLNVDDIVKISSDLTKAAGPIVPKKRVGALQRGRKLTRVGLLHRYQSFLVQELETVSWHLYGERDYAKHTIFFDDAVRDRCTSTDSGYPFFDETDLPTRARAVLTSLDIDTEAGSRRS
ncbi:hypothetical protein ACIPUD_21115 [Bradyrhizobium sp. CAR08]